mmetsp:Transcript_10940/g.37946  ORF Transcript_10940/g.37946 Transcript_10940/m.37946 type:complete len:369 (-) Transcript_10940:73-1179(-)
MADPREAFAPASLRYQTTYGRNFESPAPGARPRTGRAPSVSSTANSDLPDVPGAENFVVQKKGAPRAQSAAPSRNTGGVELAWDASAHAWKPAYAHNATLQRRKDFNAKHFTSQLEIAHHADETKAQIASRYMRTSQSFGAGSKEALADVANMSALPVRPDSVTSYAGVPMDKLTNNFQGKGLHSINFRNRWNRNASNINSLGAFDGDDDPLGMNAHRGHFVTTKQIQNAQVQREIKKEGWDQLLRHGFAKKGKARDDTTVSADTPVWFQLPNVSVKKMDPITAKALEEWNAIDPSMLEDVQRAVAPKRAPSRAASSVMSAADSYANSKASRRSASKGAPRGAGRSKASSTASGPPPLGPSHSVPAFR